MKHTQIAIVGGGAAGLACASLLARSGKNLSVTVIDAGERLGKKLAATGNGQGNVTNTDMTVKRYFGGNLPLVERLTCTESARRTEEELFRLVLHADGRGRVYPAGRQASALVDSLMGDLKRGGVDVLAGTGVVAVEEGFLLTLSHGERLAADFVVLAVGGKAQSRFHTDGTSYALAQKFGHSLTPLYPSLVQLKTETAPIKSLKGIRTDCTAALCCGGETVAVRRGDVIFTDYGVSGNAIFELSAFAAGRRDVFLRLDFVSEDEEKVLSDLRQKKSLGYARSELFSGTLHNQLGRAVIRRCASDDEQELLAAAKNFTLKVTGSLGFDSAQVTRGGICMDGVTDELESKFQSRLFFAGEVLDVDGECGGYNLHWAFCSGAAVARAILNRVRASV